MSTNYYRRNYSTGTSAVAASRQMPSGRTVGRVHASGAPFRYATAFAAWASVPVAFDPQGPGTGLPFPVRTLGRPGNVAELHPGAGSGNGVETRTGAGPGSGAGTGVAATKVRRSVRLLGSEAGMATAEYAIATLAAVGFAGLLVFILRSDEVRGFLLNLIRTALALP